MVATGTVCCLLCNLSKFLSPSLLSDSEDSDSEFLHIMRLL